MFRSLALLSLALLLSACESMQVSHDFDANRNFALYRSWSWKEPAVQYRPDDPRLKSDLAEQRVRLAVSEQLDQRGLRPANGRGDLTVQTYLIIENHHQQVITNYGGYWGGPYGYYGGYYGWDGYWGGPAYYEVHTTDYTVGTIQIDMFDGHDGKLVWRGSAEQVLNGYSSNSAERNTAIHDAVTKILANYPPK